MPYKFNDYQSTYVDPQSVAISKELRNRFMTNFQNADALDESLDAMKAADFANDEKMKAELDAEIGNKLSTIADRGDFENQAFRIHGAAKEYKERYAPIYDNYQRYANYQADLAERYKKGEISSLAYNYAIPYTKYAKGYEGIKIDPRTGMVDPNSYYSPMNIISDPKIDEKLSKALNLIKADGTSSSSTEGIVGQTDPRTGEAGKLKITQTSESSWEGITPEKVSKAYNAVMADPEVQAYLAQQAQLKAYAAVAGADGRIDQARLDGINQSGIDSHKKEIAKLEDLLASGNLTKAKQAEYKNTLESYRTSLQNLESQSGEGKLDYAASLAKQELLAPYAAMSETVIYNKTSSKNNYDEDYDALWMKKGEEERSRKAEEEKLKLEALAMVNKTPGEDITLTGMSVVDLQGKMASLDVDLQKAMEVVQDGSAGYQTRLEALMTVNSLKTAKVSLEAAMKGQSEATYADAVNDMFQQNSDYGDVDNWGFGTEGIDFQDIWMDYKRWRNDGGNEKDFGNMITQGDWEGTELNSFHRYLEQVHPGEQIWNVLDEVKNEFIKVRDKRLSDPKTITLQTTESNIPIGTSPDIALKTKTNMDNMFKDKPISALVGFSGLYRPGTTSEDLKGTKKGDLNQMLTDWGGSDKFTEAAKIVNITYNSLDAMSMAKESKYGQFVTFTVQSDKDETQLRKIHVPVEQIYSQDMLNAINEPMSQINSTIRNVQRFGSTDGFNMDFGRMIDGNDDAAIKYSKAADKAFKEGGQEGFSKFVSENAADLQRLQISGNLYIDNNSVKFMGNPVNTRMVFSGLKGDDIKVELYNENVLTGQFDPVTIPEKQRDGSIYERPLGKFSVTSDLLKQIVDDRNMGYFQMNGYNPK